MAGRTGACTKLRVQIRGGRHDDVCRSLMDMGPVFGFVVILRVRVLWLGAGTGVRWQKQNAEGWRGRCRVRAQAGIQTTVHMPAWKIHARAYRRLQIHTHYSRLLCAYLTLPSASLQIRGARTSERHFAVPARAAEAAFIIV